MVRANRPKGCDGGAARMRGVGLIVLWTCLAGGVGMALAGAAFGMAGAWWVIARYIAFEVQTEDFIMLVTGGVLLASGLGIILICGRARSRCVRK